MYLGSVAYNDKNKTYSSQKVTIEELYLSFGGSSKKNSYFCKLI
tara:strand:+ start:377 stop:508 length:132 start_codon:yes stop_codon:yes gene_type:complete